MGELIMHNAETIRYQVVKELTNFLSRGGETSYLRLADGEIQYLVDRKLGLHGLSESHYDRLVKAYQECSYLDLSASIPYVRNRLPELKLRISANTYVNDSPETGVLHRDWTYYEFHDYILERRCLIAGAEAALLEELYKNPIYRKLAKNFWPEESNIFFLQVLNNGINLERDLDLIKAEIIKTIVDNNIDTLFLSLGGGAKILCYEIAKELKITAIDWGSLARSLSYCGSLTSKWGTKKSYCYYFLRVPFEIFMEALKSAHPEFSEATLIAKAHAQLQLELEERIPMFAKGSPDYQLSFESNIYPLPKKLSNEQTQDFYTSLSFYNKYWKNRDSNNPEVKRLIYAFEMWRIRTGVSSISFLLQPILPVLDYSLKPIKPFIRKIFNFFL